MKTYAIVLQTMQHFVIDADTIVEAALAAKELVPRFPGSKVLSVIEVVPPANELEKNSE